MLCNCRLPWWRHQMETGHLCAGNSPVPGEFSLQRPVTRSFDNSFDLRLNKRLWKQSWGWWFETLTLPLWRHCNAKWWPFYSGIDVSTERFLYLKTTRYLEVWCVSEHHLPHNLQHAAFLFLFWRRVLCFLVLPTYKDKLLGHYPT